MTANEHCSIHAKERIKNGTMKHFLAPVINVTTGERFESVKDAADAYKVSRSNISAACRGKKRTIKGCVWKYAGPERIKT
jgi:hypothetical protein